MNILLTGNKGLIGSYLKELLEREGHKVVLTIDLREGKDINSLKDMNIKEKIDLVIHTAAHCKINQDIENPELAHYHNSSGTFSVLEFCRKNNIKKIINFSSTRVLSKEKNPYTASKLYGEELCKAYKDCYGIEYIIIRPSTVYGPFWDETKRLMHIFITSALKNKDIEIYGDPKTKTLDFTYIDDFIDGIILALSGPWNKEYNISGNQEYNIHQLAQYIIQKTESKSKIIIKEAETAQPQKVKVDISAIQSLGYKPKVPVEEGALRCIDWYKEYLRRNN